MLVSTIHSKISLLPQEKLSKLLNYIEFLLIKDLIVERKPELRRKPKFGSAKGTFKMAADFDNPMEDFSEYMP